MTSPGSTVEAIEKLDHLLDRYFQIGVQQGLEGRTHDDREGSAQDACEAVRSDFLALARRAEEKTAEANAMREKAILNAQERNAAERKAEALERENAELRQKLDACDWYWPEGDTSSDACADGPWQIAENCNVQPGEVFAYSRGGVVETRHFAFLPPADDSDSDDNFEVDEALEEQARSKIEAELSRRALLGGYENAE